MDHHPPRPTTALFDVYLRLRPSSAVDRERFLDVEPSPDAPTHITIQPPADDRRRRAVEKFAFTRVFEEDAGQRELFESTGIIPLIEGVLGGKGREGRDGLLATLGVTGSGKSHTILGSKSQRGITQLTLDVLFQHTTPYLADIEASPAIFASLCAADVAEAHLIPAAHFLDSIYTDSGPLFSRATTPAMETSFLSTTTRKPPVPRLSLLPSLPLAPSTPLNIDTSATYAILLSMYEVHNDRIYDLLTPSSTTPKSTTHTSKRRPLLFKSTEASPDRKVVAGLRKILCSTLFEALLVLETGLHERRVADTLSNATSSRSHGFFCLEVKKRCSTSSIPAAWTSSTLTIVDLAGSERARTAKTAGATLVEAGKINESLMYLGQCMQMQSDRHSQALVPYRQCKLTELLFSNSFAAKGGGLAQAQKGVMIVTADPLGDFNATSQILRYSALAREVTVPRIPSVASTILASYASSHDQNQRVVSGRGSPSAQLQEDLDLALAEIGRLREEVEIAQVLLAEETQRRREVEASWKAAESRIEEVEAEVREEVFEEFEEKLEMQRRQWRAARDAEMDAQDEHLDRKLDLVTKGIEVYEDKENAMPGVGDNKREREQERGSGGGTAVLEVENERLRERVKGLEREVEGRRSPSKKMRVLKTRRWDGSGMGVEEGV